MAETTFEPLFQINFLPEVMQVNFKLPFTEVDPNFLQASPDWRGMIVGKGAQHLPHKLNLKLDQIDGRLQFRDYVPPAELKTIYASAKLGFWRSRSEGQQGTAAQALCCGCSVVSNSLARMNCFRHYISRESGRLAESNTPTALAEALQLEANAWTAGQRDPNRISKIWTSEFHAEWVAREVVRLLQPTRFS